MPEDREGMRRRRTSKPYRRKRTRILYVRGVRVSVRWQRKLFDDAAVRRVGACGCVLRPLEPRGDGFSRPTTLVVEPCQRSDTDFHCGHGAHDETQTARAGNL